MSDIKHDILDEIRKVHPEFRPASRNEYRINCPFCGDTKNHCYIKCTDDPSEPMLYNCFKCNEHGRISPWFLKQIGLDDKFCDMLQSQRVNRFSQYYMKNKPIEIMTGTVKPDSEQVKYIETRLGNGFTVDDYDRFKIIWDMSNINQLVSSDRIRNTLPSNSDSISFLSDDKTMILTRTFSVEDHQWRKIKIINNDNKSFYTIKSTVDLLGDKPLTVNIAEGVFDVLSAYKNFNVDNSVYVATLGSDYISGVEYIISKGFVGSNIHINIYMDTDQDVKYVMHNLSKYKWIFGSIKIYYNALYKDIGVPVDRIKLVERRV